MLLASSRSKVRRYVCWLISTPSTSATLTFEPPSKYEYVPHKANGITTNARIKVAMMPWVFSLMADNMNGLPRRWKRNDYLLANRATDRV